MLRKAIAASFVVCAVAMSQPIVIKTTTILDGTGRVLKNQEIVVEGGRITRVSDARSKPTYDLSGLTVMPGWIDTHVHLAWHFNKANRAEDGGLESKESPQQAAL